MQIACFACHSQMHLSHGNLYHASPFSAGLSMLMPEIIRCITHHSRPATSGLSLPADSLSLSLALGPGLISKHICNEKQLHHACSGLARRCLRLDAGSCTIPPNPPRPNPLTRYELACRLRPGHLSYPPAIQDFIPFRLSSCWLRCSQDWHVDG